MRREKFTRKTDRLHIHQICRWRRQLMLVWTRQKCCCQHQLIKKQTTTRDERLFVVTIISFLAFTIIVPSNKKGMRYVIRIHNFFNLFLRDCLRQNKDMSLISVGNEDYINVCFHYYLIKICVFAYQFINVWVIFWVWLITNI